jgi:hypothetical protein
MYLLQTRTVFASPSALAGEKLCEKAVISFDSEIPGKFVGKMPTLFTARGNTGLTPLILCPFVLT